MDHLPVATRLVTHKPSGTIMRVNATDFDSSVHEPQDEAPAAPLRPGEYVRRYTREEISAEVALRTSALLSQKRTYTEDEFEQEVQAQVIANISGHPLPNLVDAPRRPPQAAPGPRKVGAPDAAPDETGAPSIATVNATDALAIIEDTDSIEGLKALEKAEKANKDYPGGRKGVLQAISDRIDALKKKAESEKGK